jgi:competence protein ComEC
LIGYREDLDKSLVQSYANTGVVHIIAISGLHLGMLYGLLLLVLKPLKKLKMPSWCQLSIVLAGLWMFSFIAGASPSVLRSAVMFSVIAVGNAAKKKANIYNTLSASAFLLLWINPFFLWDPGFQLSYAAVLSIAIFQKPITGLIETGNKILDATWSLVSISFAAQILTTPISLLQFHQQPLLFLFANAVAVPLSGIVLYGEILLLLVSNIHILANGTGYFGVCLIAGLKINGWRLDALNISCRTDQLFLPELVCYFLLGSVAQWVFQGRRNISTAPWSGACFLC